MRRVKEALLTPALQSTWGAKQKPFIRPSIDPSLPSSMTRWENTSTFSQKYLYFSMKIPLLSEEIPLLSGGSRVTFGEK